MGKVGGGIWANPGHMSLSPRPPGEAHHLPWPGKVQAPCPALASLVLLPQAMGDPGDAADSFAWSWFLGKSSKFVSQFLYESQFFFFKMSCVGSTFLGLPTSQTISEYCAARY